MRSMGKIVVLSDVHGHLEDLAEGLRRADLVDETGRWCGGDDRLYVLGDLLDRGPDGAGVVRFLRRLTEEEPERVHVLLGNHEALALGYRLVGDARLSESWQINGGRASDQAALGEDDIAWMRALPAMALVEDYLLVHSDTREYRIWGETVEQVNATVRALLGGEEPTAHWGTWARLTQRYDFVGEEGARAAEEMLAVFGGRRVVHGHTIIPVLTGVEPWEVSGPVLYAEGRALAIDGGRYAGGPLLLVSLGDGRVSH